MRRKRRVAASCGLGGSGLDIGAFRPTFFGKTMMSIGIEQEVSFDMGILVDRQLWKWRIEPKRKSWQVFFRCRLHTDWRRSPGTKLWRWFKLVVLVGHLWRSPQQQQQPYSYDDSGIFLKIPELGFFCQYLTLSGAVGYDKVYRLGKWCHQLFAPGRIPTVYLRSILDHNVGKDKVRGTHWTFQDAVSIYNRRRYNWIFYCIDHLTMRMIRIKHIRQNISSDAYMRIWSCARMWSLTKVANFSWNGIKNTTVRETLVVITGFVGHRWPSFCTNVVQPDDLRTRLSTRKPQLFATRSCFWVEPLQKGVVISAPYYIPFLYEQWVTNREIMPKEGKTRKTIPCFSLFNTRNRWKGQRHINLIRKPTAREFAFSCLPLLLFLLLHGFQYRLQERIAK